MAQNVSLFADGTPLLERRLEMPQLVKALDRAIDDERWDRVEGLISRIHEMGLGMLERREFVDIHHQVKKLAKTLVVLSKRPGAQKHRYFLCQSMSRLMQLSAVAALSERLSLVDRIPDEDLMELFALAQEIKHTDPGFYYELNCFYASYWFYCSSYDRKGIADFAKYVGKAVKAVASLKDLDPGDLKELVGELRHKFKMLPEKWAIVSIRIRSMNYPAILRCAELFLEEKGSGWFGMGYVVELARVAHARTIDSTSAHQGLRQLACLRGKKRWQLRFFACQQLMSLTGHPQCGYNQKLLQSLRDEKEQHPRVLALLNGQPAYNCGEPLVALAGSELVHVLRSHQLECLYTEVISLREQMGGMRREMQQILVSRVVGRTMRCHALRWRRVLRRPAQMRRPALPAEPIDPDVEEISETVEEVVDRNEPHENLDEQIRNEEFFARFCREVALLNYSSDVDYELAYMLFTRKTFQLGFSTVGAWKEFLRGLKQEDDLIGRVKLSLWSPLVIAFTPLLLLGDTLDIGLHTSSAAWNMRCDCIQCTDTRKELLKRMPESIWYLYVGLNPEDPIIRGKSFYDWSK